MPTRSEPCQTVPALRLCAVLGVSEMTLSRYVREGMPKTSRGHYDLAECVRWALARKARREREAIEHPRVRLLAERAEALRLQNANTRAGLVPAAEARAAQDHFFEAVDAEFAQLAADSPDLLVGLAGRPAEIQDRLFRACRRTRERIADRLADYPGDSSNE